MSEEALLDYIKQFGEYLDISIKLEVNGIAQGAINKVFPWEELSHGDTCLTAGQEIFNEEFQNYILLKDKESGKANGVIYILPRSSYLAKHQEVQLYIKRMFVTRKGENVMPDWAVFVRAIINSEKLTLTASRENVYPNENADELKEQIGEAIKGYLRDLSTTAPKTLSKILQIHSIALKRIALSDTDFLKFIYQWFTFHTTEGRMSLEEIKQSGKTVFHVPDIDEFRQIVPIAKTNGKLVVNTGYVYDADLFRNISRVDQDNDYIEIDASYFGNFLGEMDINDFELYRQRLFDLQKHLNDYECKIELKSFDPENIPAIYHANTEIQLSRDIKSIRDNSNDLWGAISEGVFGNTGTAFSKLYLNVRNSIVETLLKQPGEFDKTVVETLYINAMLLGHYPLSNKELDAMNGSLNKLIQFALHSKIKITKMELTTTEDIRDAINEYGQEYSEGNKNLMFKCVEKAKWLKDLDLEFDARYAYLCQLAFLNYKEEIIAFFPWFLTQCDKHPERFSYFQVLWSYKWVIPPLLDHANIPLEKIEQVFKDFEQRFRDQGANKVLLSYQSTKALKQGLLDEAYELQQVFLASDDWSFLNDCNACEVNKSLICYMHKEMFEEVLEVAQPLLNKELTCHNVPKTTYSKVLMAAFQLKKYDLAEKYFQLALKSLPVHENNIGNYFEPIIYAGITKKFIQGREIIEKQATHLTMRTDNATQMNFYFACYLFFLSMLNQEKVTVKLQLDKDLPLTAFLELAKDGEYDIETLVKGYEKAYRHHAALFDTRNGNQYFSNRLEKLKQDMQLHTQTI